MAIIALDFGSSSIKYGDWHEDTLLEQGVVKLPNSWEEAIEIISSLLEKYRKDYQISGIAVSVRGAVNQKEDQIYGVTAIPYIHHLFFTKELSEKFGIPVTMENDANCAALSEIWKGNAVNDPNILYFVFGTGV